MMESSDLEVPGPSGGQHHRRPSTASREHYDPRSGRNFADSLSPESLPHPSTYPLEPQRRHSQRRRASTASRYSQHRRASTTSRPDYDAPDTYVNLGETADVPPVQNPYEEPIHRYQSLELVRSQEQEYVREQKAKRRESLAAGVPPEKEKVKHEVSRLATQLYTVSYLIFFSILGTLARLGLTALTTYPGTPIIFPSIWPNFAGSLVMGFLSEDRMLFREAEEETPTPELSPQKRSDEESNTPTPPSPTNQPPPPSATKKTIPLYIGLATGFCGSLTSFSAFIRDTFLALANDLPSNTITTPRNGGYSFLALLAVPLTTLCLSLAALFLGAHLAIALAPFMPTLPRLVRTFVDRAMVLLGWGCWLGAVLMSIFPPGGHTDWRGKVTLALVFAPLGCLGRFYVSLWLNGRVVGFPVGTFVVNLAGTAVLGLAWDLAHVRVGGEVGGGMEGCQVLLGGVVDGFCGCLTTVSTWVGELAVLRRRHAYVYGGASVVGGLAIMVAVAGGVRWSGVFEGAVCK